MDFYHCIVLMHCFISGKICDYPLHNLSLSPIPPKNADGLPTKNIFFNILAPIPIARDRDCKSWHAHVALFSLEITTQQDLSFVMMLELVTYNDWLLYPWILRGSKWEGGGGWKYAVPQTQNVIPNPSPEKKNLIRACVCLD